jgi:hypothetical protein
MYTHMYGNDVWYIAKKLEIKLRMIHI